MKASLRLTVSFLLLAASAPTRVWSLPGSMVIAQQAGDRVRLRATSALGVPVHPAPGNNSVSARLPNQTIAEVLGIDAGSGWVNIRAGTTSGWITRTYVAETLSGTPSPGQPVADTLTASGSWDPTKPLVLEGDIVTMTEPAGIVANGRLVVLGEKIVAVLQNGEPLPPTVNAAEAVTVKTSGWIYPGLIDAHNHVSYNVLPLYKVPRKYTNRYQWTSPTSYKQQVNGPKNLLTGSTYYDLETEVIKYGEVKAISGGVTSIQGSPNLIGTRVLVRNIENTNFGQDRIYQRGLPVTDKRWQETLQDGLISQMNEGAVEAWLVHLAEGVDSSSRREFAVIDSLGLVRDETVVIHGTALQRADFQKMKAAGVKLVWSPLSNLLLYGSTTDIPTALQEGVVVSLGADWSPSGAKNLLGELKVAHEIDQRRFGNLISDQELVRMVTVNPAFSLGLDGKIGTLRAGLYADIAVFRKRSGVDAYRSLILSDERDVTLVLIGGEPLYGDRTLMQSLKPGDVEPLDVADVEKALDITDPRVTKGTQTFAEITGLLNQAMLFDTEHMWQTFGSALTLEEFGEYLNQRFPEGILPIPLDPVFAFGDTTFFATLRNSTVAQLGFELSTYWDVPLENPDAKLLAFLNSAGATIMVLDQEVGLDRRAAENIVRHRDGADGQFGTADDNPYDDVAELDAVPYVGVSALERLRAYANR